MWPTDARRRARRTPRGFTLVELMVGATIGSFVLAAILSTFLMLGRNGYNAANYSMMEAEARRALETFSEEARMASDLTWNSSTSVTLTVYASSGTYQVTYAYDSSSSGATAQSFYRKLGAASGAGTKTILVRNVTEFAYHRYKVVNGADFMASNDIETKQIQITLRSVRTGITTVATTNAVLSARVVLRNKAVST